MPESPEQLWERVAGSPCGCRRPGVGHPGRSTARCARGPRAAGRAASRRATARAASTAGPARSPTTTYIWTDERWRLCALRPTGLPLVVLLEPREHYDAPGELPTTWPPSWALALAGRARRARIGDIGRVHVCRWGEGSEHLHWWFMARPARIPQTERSFAAIWDDILPPVPQESGARRRRVLRALEA